MALCPTSKSEGEKEGKLLEPIDIVNSLSVHKKYKYIYIYINREAYCIVKIPRGFRKPGCENRDLILYRSTDLSSTREGVWIPRAPGKLYVPKGVTRGGLRHEGLSFSSWGLGEDPCLVFKFFSSLTDRSGSLARSWFTRADSSFVNASVRSRTSLRWSCAEQQRQRRRQRRRQRHQHRTRTMPPSK